MLGMSRPIDVSTNHLSILDTLNPPPRRHANRTKSTPVNAPSHITQPLVIVDSGSGATTVPSSTLTMDIHRTTAPMILVTANNEEVTPTYMDNFRGIPNHVVPLFPYVLLGLNDFLSANHISLANEKETFIIENNSGVQELSRVFIRDIVNSVLLLLLRMVYIPYR